MKRVHACKVAARRQDEAHCSSTAEPPKLSLTKITDCVRVVDLRSYLHQLLCGSTLEASPRQGQLQYLLRLVLSDGEAEDNDAFIRAMRALDPDLYVVVGVIGYGAAYEAALAAYHAVACSPVCSNALDISSH